MHALQVTRDNISVKLAKARMCCAVGVLPCASRLQWLCSEVIQALDETRDACCCSKCSGDADDVTLMMGRRELRQWVGRGALWCG